MTWTSSVLLKRPWSCRGLHEGGRRGSSCYHHTGTFSQGKDTLKEKRASLADETFEMLMFMRGNKHA
jgi:hypothetical protein